MSIEQLAVLAGVSPGTVRLAEGGKRQPGARVVGALAGALSSTVDQLAPPEGPVTLRQLRQSSGRTQRAVACEIGVTSQMVSRVEAGTYGVSEPERWAAAYRVTPEGWAEAHAASREDRRRRIRAQTQKRQEEQ
ncbi:transcriptional regulator (plasmid) [Streptomyces niveus]|uniref:helix-turn-helix transcriptional regulator n=1 Tax=Streptomyces niveus TaxID=193462 RepID=UPI002E36BE6D|nr:helix-turn-helix transcriptional regulator [Streptomyces niveus]